MAQQDNPYLTITLTGRPPVKIKKEDWPVVASSQDREFDNQHESQANRKASWKLTVRQHADGRVIVYGVYTFTTQYQNGRDYDIRGGELLEAEPDVPTAISRVAAELEARMPDNAHWSAGFFPRLAHECMANLPAVEL